MYTSAMQFFPPCPGGDTQGGREGGERKDGGNERGGGRGMRRWKKIECGRKKYTNVHQCNAVLPSLGRHT